MKTFTTFSEITIGQTFYANGNECVKRSTRTALLIAYNRGFYYGKDEIVSTRQVSLRGALETVKTMRGGAI
jgi:hypothetical protein